MKQGDIVVLNFPFSDLSGSKLRPAVVLSTQVHNKYNTIILAGIYGKSTPGSILLSNKSLVNQKMQKDSFISLQNIFSAEKGIIVKVIDSLVVGQRVTLIKKVRSCF